VAIGTKGLKTSRPYYRSSYVFVTRQAQALEHLSLDDARLRTLTIGVQLVGYEAMNTPPAQALAARGSRRMFAASACSATTLGLIPQRES
jgi:mxaJ protein